jgi:dTDP-4-amino-4,6-dideoxygalactose transaminase
MAERMFGVRHVVVCSSGTMALEAMLCGACLPSGSEIVTSPYTFSATAAAILHAGHQPIFADVDLTGCLDPKTVGAHDVAMPVDLFGRVASRAYYGMILADSCQAVGAYRGMAGALAAAWSMNGQKNIPAGEAGAMLTDDPDLAYLARRRISHGENCLHATTGLNGRLNELTACVAYFGLLNVHKLNVWRRRLALELWRRLKDEPRVRVLVKKNNMARVLSRRYA